MDGALNVIKAENDGLQITQAPEQLKDNKSNTGPFLHLMPTTQVCSPLCCTGSL